MNEWLTPDEAAAYLKVTRSTIYRWSDEGRLRFYELESGGGRRYNVADLDRLLQRDEDPRARHLALAAAFRRIHDELDAMSLDLVATRSDFGAGWERFVKEPSYWADIQQQAFLQSEAHRDVAPSVAGRSRAQQLFDAAVELAQRNGHEPAGSLLDVNTAHAKCQLCGAELTVGHPLTGGPPIVITNAMATACPQNVKTRVADDQAAIPAVYVPPALITEPPAGARRSDIVERIRRSREEPDQLVRDSQERAKRRR